MAHGSFAELLADAHEAGSLAAAAIAREVEDTGASEAAVVDRLREALEVMRSSIASGLAGHVRSRSGLTGGVAALAHASAPRLAGGPLVDAIARAIAIGEVNAAMGRIVAAPTGGASGVLPGVLLTVAEHIGAGDDELARALATAGAIGAIIAARATLSGAAGGCQAEVGSAAAMAAAASVELAGGSPEQSGHAASLALQGLLGLVCDPVGGLVEVPCVMRNATGAAVALAAVELALAGVSFAIPLDEVIDAMGHVGRSLPPSLRETARGGLAATHTGMALAAERTVR